MRTTNKIGFLFLINAHPHVICLHVWEGRFYLGVRMTLAHLDSSALAPGSEGPVLSTGSVLWAGSSGTALG